MKIKEKPMLSFPFKDCQEKKCVVFIVTANYGSSKGVLEFDINLANLNTVTVKLRENYGSHSWENYGSHSWIS